MANACVRFWEPIFINHCTTSQQIGVHNLHIALHDRELLLFHQLVLGHLLLLLLLLLVQVLAVCWRMTMAPIRLTAMKMLLRAKGDRRLGQIALPNRRQAQSAQAVELCRTLLQCAWPVWVNAAVAGAGAAFRTDCGC
uniref:Uncharacterized protein n=1 Tax=Anopheles melas TaxID=34690 RepID=A0A182TH02_9DIPT